MILDCFRWNTTIWCRRTETEIQVVPLQRREGWRDVNVHETRLSIRKMVPLLMHWSHACPSWCNWGLHVWKVKITNLHIWYPFWLVWYILHKIYFRWITYTDFHMSACLILWTLYKNLILSLSTIFHSGVRIQKRRRKNCHLRHHHLWLIASTNTPRHWFGGELLTEWDEKPSKLMMAKLSSDTGGGMLLRIFSWVTQSTSPWHIGCCRHSMEQSQKSWGMK